ncbi:hypothetical protein MYCTH_2311579 [Thermothelomyces thermophilus ATCC 42464]|uniref:Uncharacterized protein n=1 Tax=Thermothelomyces thermophilus (strain ATCC 42464 / BCRC 31852 / DSM 1799) TaxID=573729 RepID=G2QPB9_THET4|nr:uncharacterized protein MYCTH_2311579 [Thermothelomyces thermophilus ATCC 42464]AEO61432.1 hypothetical protein MYCTH_2311579 [Thermothelomyces thermophilus ATCC 42464]
MGAFCTLGTPWRTKRRGPKSRQFLVSHGEGLVDGPNASFHLGGPPSFRFYPSVAQ